MSYGKTMGGAAIVGQKASFFVTKCNFGVAIYFVHKYVALGDFSASTWSGLFLKQIVIIKTLRVLARTVFFLYTGLSKQ